jgi:predicted AlkP superfamily phosphohydrolase/phosphomutase
MLDLAEQGRLPNLSRLLAEGTSARLRTVFPPVTATAWASFMTGKNPGKHGIYEFLHRHASTLTNMPVSARLLASETLWSILSRHGKSVGVINVPLTYPHKPVNGFMIGDFLTPANATDYAYPLPLLREVEARFGPYPLYHRQAYSRGAAARVLDELYAVHEYYADVGLHLIQDKQWDFYMIHFAGIDRLQHELWHVFDDTHPAHSKREAARFRDQTLRFFVRTDETLGALVDAAGDDTTVVVMSDHGFGPIYRFVNVNMWLIERGYLQLKRTVWSRAKYILFRLGLTPGLFYRLAMLAGMANIRLARGMRNRFILLRLIERFFLSMADVDWSRTTAYSQGNYGQIFVNLQGREPDGIVPPEEYESVRERIVEDVKKLQDPRATKPIVETVYTREELYEGGYVDFAPDVGFLMSNGYKALGTLAFTSNKVVEPVFGNSGDHRMDGILVLAGAGIRKGHQLEQASILDMAPSILHLMGLPVELSMDGKVLKGALTSEFAAQYPVTFIDSQVSINIKRDETPYSEEEAEEIRERLKNLGYWG